MRLNHPERVHEHPAHLVFPVKMTLAREVRTIQGVQGALGKKAKGRGWKPAEKERLALPCVGCFLQACQVSPPSTLHSLYPLKRCRWFPITR